jgi:Golgi nucleoside diphosphatase
MQPGISTFAHNPKGVGAALVPLIAFAKTQLASLEDQWSTFPIYLKATAGMRELPLNQRMPIMLSIRAFLANATNNPFLFDNLEMARVISGEEEAAYAWAGVNLATGALLATSSWGSGAAAPTNAYGTLEMGGASSQVRPQQEGASTPKENT